MHGLKLEDIHCLLPLRDCDVVQVSVGEYIIEFHLQPDGNISIEGACEFLAADGRVIDFWQRGKRSEKFQFCDLLGCKVELVEIDTPKSFVVSFRNGKKLRVIDDFDELIIRE